MKLNESVGLVKELAEKACIRTKHVLHHRFDEQGTFTNYDYTIETEGKEVVVIMMVDMMGSGAATLSDIFRAQLSKIEHLVGYRTISSEKRINARKLEVRLQLA